MSTKPVSAGTVQEVLGGGRFRVGLEDGREIVAYIAGKVKMNRIQIRLWDKVDVELDPAGGHATNRIVWRR